MTVDGSYRGSSVVPPLRFLNFRRIPALSPGLVRQVIDPDRMRRAALLAAWMPILERLAVSRDEAGAAAMRAQAAGTSFVEELLASGCVPEVRLFQAIADELGVTFMAAVDPASILADEKRRLASLGLRRGLRMVRMHDAGGAGVHLVADPAIDLTRLRWHLARTPHLRASLRIAPPSALRAAVLARSSPRLLFDAQHRLHLHSPEFSARTVLSAWQGASAATCALVLLFSAWLAPFATMLAVHCVASVGFLACVALRFLAWTSAEPLRLRRLRPVDPARQPVYSVLVALYREKEIVPQLLAALGRLQWPRARLEIKLVCEADDDETLQALRAHRLPPGMELVLVPPGLPRTKPKALAYALPLCSGEFVTLYDAEDRPDPLQLVEAWQRFCEEPDDLACLQAPLVVTNGGAGALASMFSFEYAALFRGLLPWLAGRMLVLPLGGTSNHFRRAALDAVGGWDGYNVTEDAELGVRLARYGYRTGILSRPTYEDGPETLAVWLPQRIRWFKGWIQTWLVHMREPAALWRELGPASFLAMQIMALGMVLSALMHPLFAGSVLYALARLAWAGGIAGHEVAVAAIGLANIAVGYAAFIVLGLTTLTPAEKTRPLTFVALTPLYWLLLSAAAWAALWEIYRRPHHWSKTPHARPRAGAARRRP